MSTSVRCICAISRIKACALSIPTWIERLVPPSSWTLMRSTGLPVALSSASRRLVSTPSQPRETMRMAPTFGFCPILMRHSVVRSRSGGVWQQPWWWMIPWVILVLWTIDSTTSLTQTTAGRMAT